MHVKVRYNEPNFNQQNVHIMNPSTLILHIALIAIKLGIMSMNVHLLKIMWGKDLLSISKLWIRNLQQ